MTPAWMSEAICATVDPELFHPRSSEVHLIDDAVRVCRGCPVRRQCLAHALEHREWGVWGGTSVLDRKRMGVTPCSSSPFDAVRTVEIGAAIRELVSRGFSEAEACERLGVHKTYLESQRARARQKETS